MNYRTEAMVVKFIEQNVMIDSIIAFLRSMKVKF